MGEDVQTPAKFALKGLRVAQADFTLGGLVDMGDDDARERRTAA